MVVGLKQQVNLVRLDQPKVVRSNNQWLQLTIEHNAITTDGNWQLTYEMAEFSGVSYSKNKIIARWTATG